VRRNSEISSVIAVVASQERVQSVFVLNTAALNASSVRSIATAMADHGLIKAIQGVLEQEGTPLRVRRITELVDQRHGIPFVSKEQNIGALLAMEVHKPSPRWRKVAVGVYAQLENNHDSHP
jgi:hypothetical protein